MDGCDDNQNSTITELLSKPKSFCKARCGACPEKLIDVHARILGDNVRWSGHAKCRETAPRTTVS